ncbi:MAG: diguanylate cyclase [Candidatus Sericytochromatia bacterium]|nr:diguanylate cyclase [Candidatus Sericytochromatia bacterium]
MSSDVRDLGDRFHLLERLGSGGMGTVYLVEDRASDDQRALKVLDVESLPASERSTAIANFKQEYRTMNRLRHPNTCAVLDYGTLPAGSPYILMEYIQGRSLASCLPLSWVELAPMLQQLGSALSYIHREGFIHLDLKPGNIRVRTDGTLKLMDFGLMVVNGQALDTVRGTLPYMSPEVARLARVDERADLYSLGCLIYEALSGRPPFIASTALDYLRAHLEQTPRPLAQLIPEYPPDQSEVIARMLAKEPAHRYPSVRTALLELGLQVSGAANQSLLTSGFFGRQTERETLLSRLASVEVGQGSQILVTGPVGSGKTRLMAELQTHARLADIPWYGATASEVPSPYGPFTSILRQIVPNIRSQYPALWAKHEAAIGLLLPEYTTPQNAISLEPDAAKFALQSAILALLRAAGAQRGAVIAIENVEQIDPLSAEIITRLKHHREQSALLLLATSRDPIPDWDAPVQLTNLTVGEIQGLVASVLGLETPPMEFGQLIYSYSQGNPGFTLALLAHLVQSGEMRFTDQGWSLPSHFQSQHLPRDVAEALLRRIEHLSPAATTVVEFAALNKQAFEIQDALQLSAIPDDDFFDAIEALLRAQILEQNGSTLALTSVGVRETVYRRIPERERQTRHLTLARFLAHRYTRGNDLPVFIGQEPSLSALTQIANQFLHSENTDITLDWLLIAVERNLQAFAQVDTEHLLSEGLRILERMPEHPRHDLIKIDLCNFGATLAHWRFQLPKAGEFLKTAGQLLANRPDEHRTLEHWVTQGKYQSLLGDPLSASKYLQKAVELADRLAARTTGARARANLGRALFFQGRLTEAAHAFQELLAETDHGDITAWQALAMSFNGYIRALSSPQERAQSLIDIDTASEIQNALGDRGGALFSLNLLYELQMLQGAYPAALQNSQRCIELALELNSTDDHITAMVNYALACAEIGNWDEALFAGEKCLQQAQAASHRIVLPVILAFLGFLHTSRGQARRGLALCEQAENEVGEGNSYAHTLVALFRLQAFLMAGQIREAETYCHRVEHLFSSEESSETTVRWKNLLTEIKLRIHSHSEALKMSKVATEAASNMGSPPLQIAALCNQALALHQAGHQEQAQAVAQRAQTFGDSMQSTWWYLRVSLVAGHCLASLDRQRATDLFYSALSEARNQKLPLLMAQALQALAGLTGESEHLKEAQKIIDAFSNELEAEQAIDFRQQSAAGRLREQTLPTSHAKTPESTDPTFIQLLRINEDVRNITHRYESLLNEWTEQRHRLTKLNDLAHQVSHSLNLNTVLERAILLTLEITGAERGLVLLFDNETDPEPRQVVAFRANGTAILNADYSRSAVARALETGKILSVADIRLDRELESQASVAALKLRSLMCVPLTSKKETLGVLYVDSQATLRMFNGHDLDVLVAIAGHAAVAIHNATLYQAVSQRAAELERAIEQYRTVNFEASTDDLTGLRNRRFFLDQFEQELQISLRYGRSLSVVMLDLDHFKRLNDVYGHAAGDQVLRGVSNVLVSTSRGSDLPARWGGEEFIVLCSDTAAQGALEMAERIRHAIGELKFTSADDEPLPRVTVSIGITTLGSAQKSADTLLEEADRALYRAKELGRNRSVVAEAPKDTLA